MINSQDATPLISVDNLSKSFVGTRALSNVSFSVFTGETLALLGHNGSGKSTLVKVLAGIYKADPGSKLDIDADIHFIHQDLGLVPNLSTVENLGLGSRSRFTDLLPLRASEIPQAQASVARYGGTFDVTIPVSQISPAERTIVAIARATSSWTHTRNVLVLDEPTATLHGDEANRLRAVVRDLANDGVGIIYISHHLSEVVELADRAIVLRNGVVIADERRGSFDESSLVEAISGGLLHSSDRDHSRTVSNGEVRLEVDSLRTRRVAHADISVRSGEIVGLAGLVGSGREEVLAGIFGAREASMRSMTVSGKPVLDHSPHGSVKAGLGFVPADRKSLGSIPLLSARENLTIASLPRSTLLKPHLDSRAERRSAAVELGALSVHPLEPERRFNLFSGGNQQKIVIAKWLRTNPMVLLMDEPTQGVDVAARAGIHALLREMSKSGMAFLIASSDEDELAQICDRVLVLRNGRIAEELVGDQITEQDIVRASLSSDRVGNEMEVK